MVAALPQQLAETGPVLRFRHGHLLSIQFRSLSLSNLDNTVKSPVLSLSKSASKLGGDTIMAIVRKVIAAAALAGALAIIPITAASADHAAPAVKSIKVIAHGGQGDWPLAR